MKKIVISSSVFVIVVLGLRFALFTGSDRDRDAATQPPPRTEAGQKGNKESNLSPENASPFEDPNPVPVTQAASTLDRRPQEDLSVRKPLDILLEAMMSGSLENYRSCLHPQTAAAPHYGSEEAMRLWKKQLDDLTADGFDGDWRFEKVPEAEASPRLPAGSIKAYPIVGDKDSGEYILLVQVDGAWKILRLFS